MHNLQQVLVLVAVSGPSLLRNAGAVTAGDQTVEELQQMQERSSRLLGGWLIPPSTTKIWSRLYSHLLRGARLTGAGASASGADEVV